MHPRKSSRLVNLFSRIILDTGKRRAADWTQWMDQLADIANGKASGSTALAPGEYIFDMGTVEVANPHAGNRARVCNPHPDRSWLGLPIGQLTDAPAPERGRCRGAFPCGWKDITIVTDWHAEVDVPYEAGDDLQDVLEAVIRAMPVSGAVRHNASLNRLTVTFAVEASTLRQATEHAIRTVRKVAAQELGKSATPNGIRLITAKQLQHEIDHPEPVELVGMVEAGEILGVSRQRVYQLAEDHPDFPRPLAELAAGKIFTKASIEAFNKRWDRKRTGRPPKAPAVVDPAVLAKMNEVSKALGTLYIPAAKDAAKTQRGVYADSMTRVLAFQSMFGSTNPAVEAFKNLNAKTLDIMRNPGLTAFRALDEKTRLAVTQPLWMRNVDVIREALPSAVAASKMPTMSPAVRAVINQMVRDRETLQALARDLEKDKDLQDLAASLVVGADTERVKDATAEALASEEVVAAAEDVVEALATENGASAAQGKQSLSPAKVTAFIAVLMLCAAASLKDSGIPHAEQLKLLDQYLGYVLAIVSIAWGGFRKN